MSSPRMLLALWLIQPVIQAVIAILLYRRRLHREYPAFFTYIVAQIPIFCVELPIYINAWQKAYFLAFWLSTFLNLVLAFKIIHEIFLDLFKPYHALKDLGHALFRWAAAITILVSVLLVAVSPSWDDPLMTGILIVQRCLQVVQCGLVVFLLAFCRTLAVSGRRFTVGIAVGFGLIAASELVTTALFSGGRIQTPLMQAFIMAGYDAGLLLWVFYSIINRRRDLVPVLVPQRWDEALADLQPAPVESDSLIPMFEHMVDQALSKRDNARA